jgi:hypothetical protein
MSMEAGRMRIRDLLDASGVLGAPDRLLPHGVRVARGKGRAVLFSEVASGEWTARFTHLILYGTPAAPSMTWRTAPGLSTEETASDAAR